MRINWRTSWKNILTIALGVAFVISLGWGIYGNIMLKDFRTKTENEYKKSFSDLVGSLDALEDNMAKARVANSPTQKVMYISQGWKECDMAVKDLAAIPTDEVGINYVDTFLNQVGDYSKSLTTKIASVETMTEDEMEMFADMHERVILINRTMQQILNQINTENLVWVDAPPTLSQKLGIGKEKVTETVAEGEESAGENGEDEKRNM
ncbi:MAG: peptidase M4, partial [Eubacteriales bacterium]